MQQDTDNQPTNYGLDSYKTSHAKPRKNREGWRSIVSTIAILLAAPLVAWLMITYVFQSYEVDGPSMEPTLQDDDRLIVLKTGRTWSRITNNAYIPNRGEIVVFIKKGLSDIGATDDKQLIKRVIGLPGERIVVSNGNITIYNQQHPNGFNPDVGTEYARLINYTSGDIDLVVPEGEVFVVGDNRNNSHDSRAFGTVSSDQIIGELSFRIFPFNKTESY